MIDKAEKARIIACGERMLKAAEPDDAAVYATAAIDILAFTICQTAKDLPEAIEGMKWIVGDLSIRVAANFAPNTKGKNNVN